MPVYFTYDPNDPGDDALLVEKRRQVAMANREYSKYGLQKRIKLSYRPILDPKYSWKYDNKHKRSVRLEDAKRVVVYWSQSPVRRTES